MTWVSWSRELAVPDTERDASFTSGPLRQNKQTNKKPTATGDEKKHLPFSMVDAYLVPSPCSAKGLEKMTQFLRD